MKIIESNFHVMQELIERLISMKEVTGLCVLGSNARTGSRPYADIHSDFDIALFIDLDLSPDLMKLYALPFQDKIQSFLPDWLPNFKFHHPSIGDNNERSLQINIHQFVLNYEEQEWVVWNEDRSEAFKETCEIIYDPLGRVKNLVINKAIINEQLVSERIIENVAVLPITVEHSLQKSIDRGHYHDSSLILVDCVEKLLTLIYDLNKVSQPHRKRRFSELRKLTLVPNLRWVSSLSTLLEFDGHSSKEMFKSKVETLNELISDVIELSKNSISLPEDPYQTVITGHYAGWQLRKSTAADLALGQSLEYQKKMNLKSWNEYNYNLNGLKEC